MPQPRSSESATEVVRRRLTDIRTWKAEHKPGKQIAKDLGLAETTYRDALKRVEAEKLEAKETLNVDEGIPTNTHALTKVYEGIHIPTSEAHLALPEDLSRLLPALWELQEILPVLKTMAKQWSEQQSLARTPEQYQKYNAIDTVRLNDELVEAIKAYTKQHRLTQSEFLTAAVLQLLHRK
jgi:hypothetical protein